MTYLEDVIKWDESKVSDELQFMILPDDLPEIEEIKEAYNVHVDNTSFYGSIFMKVTVSRKLNTKP